MEKIMNKTTGKLFYTDKKTIFLFIATMAWMGVIFWFSSQPADDSAALSGKFVQVMDDVINWIFGGNASKVISGVLLRNGYFVRKAAHFTEYFVLGLLVSLLTGRFNVKRGYLVAMLVCMLYAISDEVHQMFVPGRGPAVTDVLLDTFGSAVGTLFIYLKK